jgi:hypothetical protein
MLIRGMHGRKNRPAKNLYARDMTPDRRHGGAGLSKASFAWTSISAH